MPLSIQEIARVCHEVNRGYCLALGDDSQQPWEDASDWQRETACDGVVFCRDNPDAPPSASHESWLERKEADGWIYGEVKDADKKTHPCFMPFGELPTDMKAKDYIFAATARALLAVN